MIKALLTSIFLFFNTSQAQISQNSLTRNADTKAMYNNPDPFCTVKNQIFIPLPDSITHGQLISFMRVHPSGKYVAFTIPNTLAGTALVDISDPKKIKIIRTALDAESAPVEPDWEFFTSSSEAVDARGTKQDRPPGMAFFRFNDLVTKGEAAKAFYYDVNFDSMYQSVARVPDAHGRYRIRMNVVVNDTDTVEYTMNQKGKGWDTGSFRTDTSYRLCGTDDRQVPLLSKDGQYLSLTTGTPTHTVVMHIKADHSCETVAALPYDAGKAGFSYPSADPKALPKITYSAKIVNSNGEAGVASYVYDLNSKKETMVSLPWLEQNSQTPSFSKDGRVFYVTERLDAQGKSQIGIAIANVAAIEATRAQTTNKDFSRCFKSTTPVQPAQPTAAPATR